MGTHEFPSYSKRGMFEGPSNNTAPRETTAEGSSQMFDTSWQPPAGEDCVSNIEALCHDLRERLAQVEKEVRRMDSNQRVWFDSVDSRLQHLKTCHSAFLGGVTQKDLQEKEEYKKMKEKIEELESRNKDLLSKMVGMHKHSENMNDPSRLSAVLAMYDMLRIHDWEKLRISGSHWTYKTGSSIIRKLFDACEKDIQQRTTNIFTVLDIPPPNDAMTKKKQKLFDDREKDPQQRTTNKHGVLDIQSSSDAMTNSKQRMMQDIRNILKYSYHQKNSEFYSKITMQAGIGLPMNDMQREFTVQCCKVYCLLLLQDPPVKAVWNLRERSMQQLEHVDKKSFENCRTIAFLWPIMKSGEEVIVKGVVWDEI